MNLSCNFCGKKQSELKKLIAGPGVYICDKCINLCNDILNEDVKLNDENKVYGSLVEVLTKEIKELTEQFDRIEADKIYLLTMNEKLKEENVELREALNEEIGVMKFYEQPTEILVPDREEMKKQDLTEGKSFIQANPQEEISRLRDEIDELRKTLKSYGYGEN